VRALLFALALILLLAVSTPARAQVQDEWTPYLDTLNDYAAEVASVMPDGAASLDKVALHIKAGTPRNEFEDEIAKLADFIAVLERVKGYLDSIDDDLYAWTEKIDEYDAAQQNRIRDVSSYAERLRLIVDGYYLEAVEMKARAEGVKVEGEAATWRFGFSSEAGVASGEAYDQKQGSGDYNLNLKWERSDGLLLELTGQAENNHIFENTHSQTLASRQRYDFEGGSIQLREQYKDTDGLDNAANTREDWLIDLDFNKEYGGLGSYFRLNGTYQDRPFKFAVNRSYTYKRFFGIVHHELSEMHSAEVETDVYEFNYGPNTFLSQETVNYRLGWESALENGIVLSADYYGTDKDYPDSQAFSYTENALRLGAKWEPSSSFVFDFRFKTIGNDRNEIAPQGQVEMGVNDYDEQSYEARIYAAPQDNLIFNFRGILRDRTYTIASPFDLEQGSLSLHADYYPSENMRLFAEGVLDRYDYATDLMTFDRHTLRGGCTYIFPGASSVGAEFSFTEQSYDENNARDFDLGEFLASYNKYWKNFRLRAQGGISELSQPDANSTNIYAQSKLALDLTWYASPNVRLSVGTDFLDRNYDNQPDVTDWLMYAKLAFNF
jgi:hypothetical protein